MFEEKKRHRRPPVNRRRKKIGKYKNAAMLFAALILAGICVFAVGEYSGTVKGVVKSILGNKLYAIQLMGPWSSNAKKAYMLMKDKMNELEDAVPWFVQTDQHGRLAPTARWMHHMDPSVRNISLGDVTTDYFNEQELTAFSQMMSPIDNRICVYGNHDIWTKSAEEANYSDLARFFSSDGQVAEHEQGYFTVIDDQYCVKYLVISPYYINLETGVNGTDITVKTEQMTWLLKELSANDGYDIVVLMHQLFTDTYYSREGVRQTWADAPVILEKLWEVMKDRRNKRSGAITDGEGMTHEYDFSNVETKLLCSLHGHAHEELMLTEDGMTAYVANWLSDDKNCAFGLIDRENGAMYIWQFNNSVVLDMLTLPI